MNNVTINVISNYHSFDIIIEPKIAEMPKQNNNNTHIAVVLLTSIIITVYILILAF